MKRTSYADMPCPMAQTLERVGEWWSLLILRDAMFRGLTRYSDFMRTLEIAPNILAKRLAGFVEAGLMAQGSDGEYRLTEKGADLLPAMLALRQWGAKHQLGVESNPVLTDRRDNLPIAPIAIHAADGREIGWHELQWRDQSEVGQSGEGCCD